MPSPYRRFVSPKRPLYFMIKPAPALAETIWDHPRADKRRPSSLLHSTLIPLVDLAAFPADAVKRIDEIMPAFDRPSFRVVFDTIDERRVVALRGSEPMQGARKFQDSLTAFLRENGFPFIGRCPEIHLTIRYRSDGLGTTSVHPMSWRVKEVLLIESVVGEARHVTHGSWSLRL